MIPNCQNLLENYLDAHIEGRLPWRRRWAFHLHLWLCRDCRHYVDSYRRTRDLLRQTREENLPPAPPELLEMILKLSHRAKEE